MNQIDELLPPIPFTRSQAEAAGVHRCRLKAAVANRQIRRLLRNVYVSTSVPDSTLLRAQAARLVISKQSVLCDRTAAWVHRVDALRFRELDVIPPLESYVLRGHDPTDRPECDGGTRDLLPCDWLEIEGVKVTTPLRTAMDLGCKLRRREALAAMDALMRLYGFTLADMVRLLPRFFRRRGVIQLRELVPLVDGRAESAGESWTRLELVDHGLPMPEPQHWICVDGVPTYRLDLAYPHARVVVEYDGEEFHTGPEARERDRQRRKWLRDHGWTVIVVTKESFTDEAISEWIGEVRVALGLR
jgi:hypothetical protein